LTIEDLILVGPSVLCVSLGPSTKFLIRAISTRKKPL